MPRPGKTIATSRFSPGIEPAPYNNDYAMVAYSPADEVIHRGCRGCEGVLLALG
jgi:hypothetical protein